MTTLFIQDNFDCYFLNLLSIALFCSQLEINHVIQEPTELNCRKVASSSTPVLVACLSQQHHLKEQKFGSSTSWLVAHLSQYQNVLECALKRTCALKLATVQDLLKHRTAKAQACFRAHACFRANLLCIHLILSKHLLSFN